MAETIVKGSLKNKVNNTDVEKLYPETSADQIVDLAPVGISNSYTDLTNKPTSLKNPYALNLKVNSETSNFISYDGSSVKNITIAPSTTNGAFTINDGTTTKTIQLAGNFNNYYHTPDYSSGLKIATGSGVNSLYVPDATTSQKGVLVLSSTNLNTMINQLATGDSVPGGNDYYISQYANGGTTTTTYHRRPVSKLAEYVRGSNTSALKVSTINAPTSAGGSTYGPGSNGQVLKTNGSTVYWGNAPSASDPTVEQTFAPFDTGNYFPLILGFDNDQSASFQDVTNKVYYSANNNLFAQPDEGELFATTFVEDGVDLADKYLGISATAANSSKLNGQAASYYLNYNNLSNKPTIDNNNQKVKAGSVTFDANNTVNFAGSGIVSVTGDATNDVITISASHQSIKTLKTDNTTAQSTSSSEAIAGSGTINLHKVAKTGTYSDLIGKPTLGTAAAKNFTTSVTSGSSDLVTSGAVWTAIDNLPEPMVFKGTLGTNGTITSLPTASASNEGYTYKVITAGTYASQSARVGDVFVSNGSAWVIIPAGDTDSDTWRNIKVNDTQLLGTAISTGAVNFKNGGNITVTGSGNNITLGVASGYSIPSTTNQTAWSAKYDKPSGGIPASDLAETYYLASNPSGYTSNTGTVTSVTIKAGTGLSSSSTAAITTSGERTISIASGYKLPTTTEWSGKQDALPTTTTAGKVLKSTSTAGTLQWEDDNNTNQTVKVGTTTFGANDVVNFEGNGATQVSVNTSTKTISIYSPTYTEDIVRQENNTTNTFHPLLFSYQSRSSAADITTDTVTNKSYFNKYLYVNSSTNALYAASFYENGTALSSKYLGISSKAADADKLDGNDSSYFYPASNPNGYTSVTESTVSGWGFTKNAGTVTSVDSTLPVNGNVALSAVSYAQQTLTDAQKTQARSNIGAGTVTSVRVQAGTGLSSSTSTAQTSTLNTTISIASGYKLPTTTEWNGKATDSAVVHKADNETITGTKTFTSSDGIKVADEQSAVTYGLTYIGKGPVNNPPALIYHFPETSGTLALTSDIPSVSNATITIKQTGISDQTFTLNGSAKTITLVDTNTWRPIGTGATDAAAGNHAHGNITNTGTITSTAVTSATGFLVYDSNNKIQRVTSANARTIIGAGTVTSVATSGTGLSGGTITSTGTITLDSSSAGNAAANKVVLRNAAGSIQTEKLAVSSGTTTKATMQYNTTEDCVEFIFA